MAWSWWDAVRWLKVDGNPLAEWVSTDFQGGDKMAYMYLVANCISCKCLFTCNPDLVPSLKVNGVKEPLCRSCTEVWEKIHGKTDTILPGAYEPQEVA